MPVVPKKPPKRRGRLVPIITYITPEQRERLRATVAYTQVPGARLIRAGLDLILNNPALVQGSPDVEVSR